MQDNADPLCCPKVSMAPARPASALAVGAPSLSMAQPNGIALPLRRCNSISPLATALVAKSNTYGTPPGRGHENAIGLVPNTGLVPPAGATQLWLGVSARPIRPSAASCSTSGHRAEKW